MPNDVEPNDGIVRLNDIIVVLEDDVNAPIVLRDVLDLACSDVIALEVVSC